MPKLTVEGHGTFEVPEGKRLILALREEAGTDQLHACGGKAKCTTCKVEFVSGAPTKRTKAELDILKERGLDGVHLSCQISCDQDMEVKLVSRLDGSGRSDCGSDPEPQIVPEPEWVETA